MEKTITATLALFIGAPILLSQALVAAPSYEMQRICRDKAVRHYHLKRETIHTAVPRYLDGRYSVYAKSPKKGERALFFVCDFTRKGRFIRIKTEKDLRREANQAARRSCRGEAASVWNIPFKKTRITGTKRIDSSRYHLQVEAGRRVALCDVNSQGHIYRFRTSKRYPENKTAQKACRQTASRLWRVRASTIVTERVRKIHTGRYDVRLRYGRVWGVCDVSGSGHVYHFRTHLR